MQPYQERVVAEKKELDERIAKLAAFLRIPNKTFESLSAAEQDRLHRQFDAMNQYSTILTERIAAFTE